MVPKILQKGHPSLRQKSKEVDPAGIRSAGLKKILGAMHQALAEAPDGVALAAPQIGQNLRIFVVSPRAFGEEFSRNERLVYINPRILRRSRKKVELEEGCLSVRNMFGLVKRYEKVLVKATDEKGRPFTRGGSALLAEIFQHEIDHLDGILFTDQARDLHEVKAEEPEHEQ